MNFPVLVFLLTCLPSALMDFALPKWKADKNVHIEDAYKWTYQATRGGEHAVPDQDSARKWLDDEWSSLAPPTKGEQLWEPLCPGDEIGRLNLRAFKAKGGKIDDILQAFLASSREYRSENTAFAKAWAELGRRIKKRSYGNLDGKSWSKLDADMRPKGYPAIHHSPKYEKAENPAYRIITQKELKKLLQK